MLKDWERLLSVEGGGKPLFRVYRWSGATLSVGYRQKVPLFPLPVVERPTGGGALLHGWDVCFSYAGIRREWGSTPLRIYRNFMGLMLETLREIDAGFEISKYRGAYEGFFCYFYPTSGEITYRGRKVVACAMRMLKNAFLIHGSLFIDFPYREFESLSGISTIRGRITTFRELGVSEGLVLKALDKMRNLLK